MPDIEAKIYYLYHSGFAVQTPNHFLIFDYYRNEAEKGREGLDGGVLDGNVIATKKNIVVFVSHSHGDHFNPIILGWQKQSKNIKYIVSSDIPLSGDSIFSMEPYEKKDFESLSVKTFGSTDKGVSFLVEVDGLSIFHAGDLNWWHWKEESTQEEVDLSEKEFKKELSFIEGNRIDIAFFPADPRLGKEYDLGALSFRDTIKPSMLLPMHFGDNFVAASEFSLKAWDCDTMVPIINRRGQEVLFRKPLK